MTARLKHSLYQIKKEVKLWSLYLLFFDRSTRERSACAAWGIYFKRFASLGVLEKKLNVAQSSFARFENTGLSRTRKSRVPSFVPKAPAWNEID